MRTGAIPNMSTKRTIPLSVLAVVTAAMSGVAPTKASEAVQSPRLAEVERRVAAGDRDAVGHFWADARRDGTPLVEPIRGDDAHVLATFVWKGTAETKDIVLMAQPDGIVRGRDPRSHLIRLAGTDIWYRTHVLPADAEFSYLFSVDPPGDDDRSLRSTTHEDPFNPRRYRILTGPIRSIAAMPAVPVDRWTFATGRPTAQLRHATLTSAVMPGRPERGLEIYTTPTAAPDPNLLVFLDSEVYTKAVRTPLIVDNLFAAGRIGPTVAVFVADGSGGDAWMTDTYFNDTFVAFVADELVPWVEREYHFKAKPARTVIVGDSIHGLAAAYAGLRRPGVFGRVISQSGSFWLNNRDADGGEPEWLARQFMTSTRPAHQMFCLDVGQMEFVANEADRVFPPFVPGSTSLLASNRHLRDILRLKGYPVRYIEVYADHEPLHWERTLPDALLAMVT
jgi:enterochelin esterase family protein